MAYKAAATLIPTSHKTGFKSGWYTKHASVILESIFFDTQNAPRQRFMSVGGFGLGTAKVKGSGRIGTVSGIV